MSSSAAVVGRSHESAGVPCQDATASRLGAVTAVALADGAGSAPCSDLGARLAASAAVDTLATSFDELYAGESDAAKGRVIAAVMAPILAAASAAAAPVSHYASTLLFVAVKDRRFIAGHIGDGVVVAERDGRREVISHPQRGEHVNETVFVTSPGAASQLVLERADLATVSAFAIMSDGAAESLYLRKDRTTAAALTSMWRWLDEHPPEVVCRALARNLRDQFRTSTGDDCSVAMLRRVTVMPEQLGGKDPAFASAFLGCRSRRGLRNRLAVLAAMLDAAAPTSNAELSARSSLSESTVRRHAGCLRQLAETTAVAAMNCA